jgi:hypothetical protein
MITLQDYIDIPECIELVDSKLTNGKILINNIRYGMDFSFNEHTYEQNRLLQDILNEKNNHKNVNRLLAIYVRPTNKFGKVKKFKIEKHEQISKDLLQLNLEDFKWIMEILLIMIKKILLNINIHILNEQKKLETPWQSR